MSLLASFLFFPFLFYRDFLDVVPGWHCRDARLGANLFLSCSCTLLLEALLRFWLLSYGHALTFNLAFLRDIQLDGLRVRSEGFSSARILPTSFRDYVVVLVILRSLAS